MLESLIRLSEANARLHMQNKASLFDAVTVILLVEQTLATQLFGLEPTPSPMFRNDYEF
jgi:DNA replicative helicase MCM subunit Mcm2 (Cdc46/Mcm family)